MTAKQSPDRKGVAFLWQSVKPTEPVMTPVLVSVCPYSSHTSHSSYMFHTFSLPNCT